MFVNGIRSVTDIYIGTQSNAPNDGNRVHLLNSF